MDSRDTLRDWDRDRHETNYVLIAFIVMIAIAGIAALGYYLTRPPVHYVIPKDVYERLDRPTQTVVLRLAKEPCNIPLASRLADVLNSEDEYAAALSLITNTENSCGKNPGFSVALIAAQEGVGDFAGAEATLSWVLKEVPGSARAYFERSEVRENLGNLSGAYTDLKAGMYIFSDPATIRWEGFYGLATLAAKTNRPCEAVAILQDFVSLNNSNTEVSTARALMADWKKQGSCHSSPGAGSVRMRYDTHAPSIVVPVEVNGVESHLIVDTGASRTVFTKAFAKRAGIKTSVDSGAITQTANGNAWHMGGRAKKISLGEATATDVQVFIQATDNNNFGSGIDGLLGLSFLGNFQFIVNGGVLELKPLQ